MRHQQSKTERDKSASESYYRSSVIICDNVCACTSCQSQMLSPNWPNVLIVSNILIRDF